MNDLISHSVTRWSLPILIFLTIYGIFKFIEDNASPNVKQSLSEFLQTSQYERYLGVLPVIIETTFTCVFGIKHFSRRCIKASILFSWLAISATLSFSLLYNYSDVVNMVSNDLASAKIMAQEAHDQAGAKLWETTPNYKVWIFYIFMWVLWGLMADYLALLKIRILLVVLKYTDPRNTSVFVTVIIDFMVGVWAFLTSYAVALMLLDFVIYGAVPSFKAALVLLGLVFGTEAATYLSTGQLFVGVPIANMFWASMLPSMWLWAYIISSLLTRMLIASKPALRTAIDFVDVMNHPVRSVGLVAAFIPAVVCAAVLIGLSFI